MPFRLIFMRYILFLLLIVIIPVSCSNEKQNTVYSNFWSDEEIVSLKQISDFFEENFLDKYDSLPIKEKYVRFLESFYDVVKAGDILNKLSSKRSIVDSFLSVNIKKPVFGDIWIEYYQNNKPNPEYDINLDGRYLQWLGTFCYSLWKHDYRESIIRAGDISAGLTAGTIFRHDRIDLDSEVNRLIIAVHFITITMDSRIL